VEKIPEENPTRIIVSIVQRYDDVVQNNFIVICDHKIIGKLEDDLPLQAQIVRKTHIAEALCRFLNAGGLAKELLDLLQKTSSLFSDHVESNYYLTDLYLSEEADYVYCFDRKDGRESVIWVENKNIKKVVLETSPYATPQQKAITDKS
jgi:hypothetical protein